jgi:ankyrin repeat protein
VASRLLAVIALTALRLVGLASAGDPDKARQKLAADNIPFTSAELLSRIHQGDARTVALLLEAGIDVDAAGGLGMTPLHMAARDDRAAGTLALLLRARARLDPRDLDGQTPLCLALHAGRQRNAIWLITSGADVKSVCKGLRPLLHVAVREAGAGAAQVGLAEVVSALLAKGADANSLDPRAETPLYVCVSAASFNPEVARALLAAGADVNLATRAGTTPLHAAAVSRHAEAVRVLLAAGARLEARNHSGATPLFEAANADADEVVAALLAAGADPRAADARGVTPLQIAETVHAARSLALLQAALERQRRRGARGGNIRAPGKRV